MGANVPHYMIGTAPEASYWLLRSEDMSSEQPIEMDYWAAAIEFADSVGVDLVNSSLGYNKFDNPNDCFRYWHLDGKTLLISEVASMAAEKGIIDRNNGTSFSAPVMCGGVACLWQALPHLTVKEVLELVRRHGDNAEHPDCIYGYGVPDLWKAYQEYINM